MSRLNIMVIAILALVLMVVFGRNPVDEARKARKKAGGDKLVQRVVEFNNKQKKGSMFSLGNGRSISTATPTTRGYPSSLDPVPAKRGQPGTTRIAPPRDDYYPPVRRTYGSPTNVKPATSPGQQ